MRIIKILRRCEVVGKNGLSLKQNYLLCLSWMAAKVATEHMIVALCVISINDSVNGKINRSSPVILFIIVCWKISFFVRKNPDVILPVLMMAIIAIHTHNQLGMWIVGHNFIEAAAMNIISAMESNCAPNLVLLFVALATAPSIISLTPQMRYVM